MGASYSNTLRISERRVQGRSPGGFVSRTTAIYSCPATVRGCGGIIPPRGQGAEPLGHSRAFSDMRGERAPAMTRRGKRVSAERKECSGSPGESIFGGVKSRRFIAGVAEMNVWRRPVRAAGYCRASRTTAFYLHPAIVWGCGGIIPPRGARGSNTLAHAPSNSILSATRAMNSPLVGFSLAE